MKESKLSPFDGDLLAMIADITKVEPKVTENDNKFIVDVQPELTIPGDYIIKGVKGEFYPCKPDIFKQTYDPAE